MQNTNLNSHLNAIHGDQPAPRSKHMGGRVGGWGWGWPRNCAPKCRAGGAEPRSTGKEVLRMHDEDDDDAGDIGHLARPRLCVSVWFFCVFFITFFFLHVLTFSRI